MFVTLILTGVLVVATCLFHYETLRLTSTVMPRLGLPPRIRVPTLIIVALGAHLTEIAFYALAFRFSVEGLGLGAFRGVAVTKGLDYLYFSAVTYTSLGLGDVFPVGHLRFLAAVEALNGLLLIAWSGAFTYVAMGKLWPWDPCHEEADRGAAGTPAAAAARPIGRTS